MNYNYSFSGADCDVWAYRRYVGGKDIFVHLKTIATLSTSVYESKSPVRRLGRAGVVGYTGATRTIAGSMIFILTGEHPLKELHAKNDRKYVDSNKESNSTLSGVIAPFNILMQLSNEVGEEMFYRLEGVEVVSEGIVTSANDMTTELVIQFVATDMKNVRKTESAKIKAPKQAEEKSTKPVARKKVISLSALNSIVTRIINGLNEKENLTYQEANKIISTLLVKEIGSKSALYKHIDIFLEIFKKDVNAGKVLIETFDNKYKIYNGEKIVDIRISILMSLKERYEEVTL